MSMEDDDWDLNAVVRGCATTSISATCSTSNPANNPLSVYQPLPDNFPCFPDLFETRTGPPVMDLHHLYKPFFLPNSRLTSPQILPIKISPLLPLPDLQDLSSPFQIDNIRSSTTTPPASVTTTITKHTKQSSRPKRRKNQMKRVCQVPVEGLSSDMWSWRKYGQKPIKGSPYPRGYYRCSTSKGCMARKQVERHRSDPNMFIVTYTADHNHPMSTHRNSLAGSTRHKTSSSAGDVNNPSSPNCSLSPATEKDEDELAVPDMAISDDFFAGLEDIAGPSDGDSFSDQFAESFPFSWVANTSSVNTTAAVDGG